MWLFYIVNVLGMTSLARGIDLRSSLQWHHYLLSMVAQSIGKTAPPPIKLLEIACPITPRRAKETEFWTRASTVELSPQKVRLAPSLLYFRWAMWIEIMFDIFVLLYWPKFCWELRKRMGCGFGRKGYIPPPRHLSCDQVCVWVCSWQLARSQMLLVQLLLYIMQC